MENSSNIITLQFSIFGDFSHKEPTAPLIIKLLEALKEDNYIPQTIRNQETNQINSDIVTPNVLSLNSPSTNWSIVLLDNRIDFNYYRLNESDENKSLQQLIQEGTKNINYALDTLNFPNLPFIGNRLAVNTQVIIEGLLDSQIINVGKNIIPAPTSHYASGEYEEWSATVNNRESLDINDNKNEEINNILEIKNIIYAYKDQKQDSKAILIHNDINTVPNVTDVRFTKDDFINFIGSEKVKSVIQDSVREISENNYDKHTTNR